MACANQTDKPSSERGPLYVARAPMVALVALALLPALDCSANSDIEEKATWLCKYDQLDEPDPKVLPDDERLRDYLHPADLEYLAGHDGPGALGAAIKEKMEPAARVATQIKANNTECSVESIEHEQGWARATVVRRAPDPDFGLDVLLDADDTDHALQKYRKWYEDASGGTRTEYTVDLIDTDDGWRGYLGLERRELKDRLDKLEEKLSEADEALEALREEKERIEHAREKLSDFEVTSAELSQEDPLLGPDRTRIDLEVENNTDHAVSHAYFRGVYRTPGRQVPWHEGLLNREIEGGIEPGESMRWRLKARLMGDWHGVELRDEAELEIEPVRLDGPDGESLWKVPTGEDDPWWQEYAFWDEGDIDPVAEFDKVKEKRDELQAEADAIRDRIDELSPGAMAPSPEGCARLASWI